MSERLSVSLLGQGNPFYGKKHKEETKERISSFSKTANTVEQFTPANLALLKRRASATVRSFRIRKSSVEFR